MRTYDTIPAEHSVAVGTLEAAALANGLVLWGDWKTQDGFAFARVGMVSRPDLCTLVFVQYRWGGMLDTHLSDTVTAHSPSQFHDWLHVLGAGPVRELVRVAFLSLEMLVNDVQVLTGMLSYNRDGTALPGMPKWAARKST